MSKQALNIFNVGIYNQLVHDFELSLNGLIKYNKIYEKMDGYYTKEEISYIFDVYINQIFDLINSKLFDLFVPKKVKKEIVKYFPGIKSNYNQGNYNRVIGLVEKIRDLFVVKFEYDLL